MILITKMLSVIEIESVETIMKFLCRQALKFDPMTLTRILTDVVPKQLLTDLNCLIHYLEKLRGVNLADFC